MSKQFVLTIEDAKYVEGRLRDTGLFYREQERPSSQELIINSILESIFLEAAEIVCEILEYKEEDDNDSVPIASATMTA